MKNRMKVVFLAGFVLCTIASTAFAIEKVRLDYSKSIKKEVIHEEVKQELLIKKYQQPKKLKFIPEESESYKLTAELALASYLSAIWPSNAVDNPERSIRATEIMTGIEYSSKNERLNAISKLKNRLHEIDNVSTMRYPDYFIDYACKCDDGNLFVLSRVIYVNGQKKAARVTYWLEKSDDEWMMSKGNAYINGLLRAYTNGAFTESISDSGVHTVIFGEKAGATSVPIESLDNRVLELVVDKGVIVK